MTRKHASERPSYISSSWMRCTEGLAFLSTPPAHIAADTTLDSPSDWEQLACITLQAEAGDFRNMEKLLQLISSSRDDHLRDCAVRVFSMAAPTNVVDQLITVFRHPSLETRIEAYSASLAVGRLNIVRALARRRTEAKSDERERIMDHISATLEPEGDELELVESRLSDDAFIARVEEICADLETRFGKQTAFYLGEPLAAAKLATWIAQECGGEDPVIAGGRIADQLAMLEGMTGISYAGCLDVDCMPVLPKISHFLNRLQQSGALDRLRPGLRYFFNRELPRLPETPKGT